MGANAIGWSFSNRGIGVPLARPRVMLQAPSGQQWTWDGTDEGESVCSTAVEFCQVVTQTRNVANTSLAVHGDAARRWMSIAQCFAGPPEDPSAPGSRFKSRLPE
jgi:uncharacterized protein (TIGR03084 family)